MHNNVKLIAFYLPQYHTIPENDKWWGKGFTEWERVKKARPLFKGHKQPRIPYKYYNLLDKQTMAKQSEMALNHGIDGFCYYHYWFNGKRLLEKPLEHMLKDKRIKIPFCLSWANEPWTRAWDGKPKEILIDQNYGDVHNWEEHINYLIPYFLDDRYIKINDEPVFLIYHTAAFNKFDEMIYYWKNKLSKYGIKGLFLIETLNSLQTKPVLDTSKGVLEFEPMYTLKLIQNNIYSKVKKKLLHLIPFMYNKKNYDLIWEKLLDKDFTYNKTKFLGAFVDWDNTPRFGPNSTIFVNGTPEKFKYYLHKQIIKANSSYIFINAWNEWAEGAYLEPDNFFNYGYLEAILSLKKYFE